ncbi:hypothetical protein PMI29_04413, partial [Pseudomonas sp. GM49]
FGGEAVAKQAAVVLQVSRGYGFYDGFAAERSLRQLLH